MKEVKLVSVSEKLLLERLQNHISSQARKLKDQYCIARNSGEPLEIIEADLVIDCEFEPIRLLVLDELSADYQKPDPKSVWAGQCF